MSTYILRKNKNYIFWEKNKNYVETWAHISASPALGPISEAGPVRHQILWLLCIFLVHFWPSLNISRNILTSLKNIWTSLFISEYLWTSLSSQYLCRELSITAYQFHSLTVSFGHSLLIHTMSTPTCRCGVIPREFEADQCQPAVAESSQELFEA